MQIASKRPEEYPQKEKVARYDVFRKLVNPKHKECFMKTRERMPVSAILGNCSSSGPGLQEVREEIEASNLLAFVVSELGPFLRRKCKIICASHRLGQHDAEDLCSDTLCQIGLNMHVERPPLDRMDEWEKYLSRIANNLVLNLKRGAVRRKAREDKYGYETAIRKQELAGKAPESKLFRDDIQRVVEEGCDARMQEVFLRWREGTTRPQIAEELDISKTTVNRVLKKALAIVRDGLQNSGW